MTEKAFIRFNQADIRRAQRKSLRTNLLWLALLVAMLALATYGTCYYAGYYQTH